jgi:predicted MPP superfamily phosphohydrolase
MNPQQSLYQLVEIRQWGKPPAWWQEPFQALSGYWKVVHLVVPIPKLTAPITLLHLSDLHWDWNTKTWFEGIAPQLNALPACDAVVCTGDFIATGNHGLDDVASWFASIKPELPHFACMGNHDYADGANTQSLALALKNKNIRVLIDEITTLQTPNNPPLQLAGLDDYTYGKPKPQAVFDALDDALPSVLLVHNPTQTAEHQHPWGRFGLMLAGHTHGGQFPCPHWFAEIIAEAPYVRGVYRPQPDSLLYVNSASGTASVRLKLPFLRKWFKFPLIPVPRWGMMPEVTLVRLVPE